MVIRTTRQERAAALRALGPERFASYWDYFLCLHLHPGVRALHVLGMCAGLVVLPFAVARLSVVLGIVYFALFYGLGFVSHWLFDGVVSRTASEAPWKSFDYAVRVNLLTLFGRFGAARRALLERYPFVQPLLLGDADG